MTVTELENFRELLLQQEGSLTEWLNSGSSARETETSRVRALLDEIRNATGRIADRAYGNCKSCDGQVELHRLGLQPTEQLCLDCISDQEKAVLEDDLFFASKIHRALLPQAAPTIEGLS